jgi:hypothetical protein
MVIYYHAINNILTESKEEWGMVNQLEALRKFEEGMHLCSLIEKRAAFLGNVKIYINELYMTIYSPIVNNNMDSFHMIIDKRTIVTRDSVLSAIRDKVNNTAITILGCGDINLDPMSIKDTDDMIAFNRVYSLLKDMTNEYDSFVQYVKYHPEEYK